MTTKPKYLRSTLYSFSLLIFIFVSSFTNENDPVTGKEILTKSREALLTLKTISYSFSSHRKQFYDYDTTVTKGEVHLEKKAEDSLMECHFKAICFSKTKDEELKMESFYNGTNYICLIEPAKVAYLDSAEKKRMSNPEYIKNTSYLQGLMTEFSDILPYNSLFSENAYIQVLPPEKTNGYSCYKLEIKFKNLKDINKNRFIVLYIDRKTFLPVRKIEHLEYQNRIHHSDMELSNILVNSQNTKKELTELRVPADFRVKRLKTPVKTQSDYQMPLEEGTEAPPVELQRFPKKEIITSSMLKDNLTLLVFWYMGSYPFEVASPHIDSLFRTFKNEKFQVVGINSLDAGKSQDDLVIYLKNKNISYPIALDENKKTSERYKVWEYPTLYLIDREQKIVFSHKGYDDELPARLDSAIIKALR